MKITYDQAADGAYIELATDVSSEAAWTYLCDPVEIKGMINLDFDENDVLVGIEVMGASKRLPPEVLAAAAPPRPPK